MSVRNTMNAVLLAALLMPSLGCDKSPDPPGQIAQNKKEAEGKAWRGLLQALEGASTPDSKIRLLEQFIQQNPQHPDAAEAKRRLEELQNDPDTLAKKAVAEVAQKGVEEGQPIALLTLFASESVRQFRPRLDREDLSAPIEVPTTEGLKKVEKSVFVHPLVLRGHIRRALMEHAKGELEERCSRKCVNEAIGGILAKSIGGALFLDEGKMNPDAVGPLMEKTWVDPDSDLLGLPARSWYAIYAPTVQAYASVDAVIKGDPATAGAKELAALTDAKEIADFYTSWAEKADLAKKTGLPAGDARAIAGWWLRRYADGTAPLFEAQLAKVLEAYDPDFKPAE